MARKYIVNAVEKELCSFSTGGPVARRRARRACVPYEVRRTQPHPRLSAPHSGTALKRIHGILFNCAGYTIRSKEEKLAVVKQVLAGRSVNTWEPEIRHHQVQEWVKKYQAEGESGLAPKKKPGNPLSRYERRKELTYEEQIQYQIELLKRELLKKESEVARLKRLNVRKEGDARRK